MSEQQRLLLYIGSYAEAADSGVYVVEMNPSTGELTRLSEASGLKNPTFLKVDKERRKLYAISETTTQNGGRIGETVSFAIDPAAGSLEELNRAFTLQPSTSHIELEPQSRYVVVSGYHGGNVGLVRLQDDGLVDRQVDERQHEGQGADPVRQDRPHPHSALFTADSRYVLVADLGLDKVFVYRLDAERDQLVYHSEMQTEAAAGPRHLAFHPNGKWLYSINEVNSSLTLYTFDPEAGTLSVIDSVPTLPEDFKGENTTAEVAISRDGKYLYGSNRGHDSIVVFAIDQTNGKLSLVQHTSSEGGHPRHFALTPTGEYLIVANRDSDNLAVFRVDSATGKLNFTGHTAQISKPVCVQPVLFQL
ncbi:lactonase family protein [Paenibacillus lentus]|uniref:Lactonase family protein n=1 Tax=Paenibacillus lentus TaxID=1338368 RepID=A0A3Q8S610_9BACL|nr:lactonase family protein [Paenibacillus lentus]AZK47863.1 lactonase family protein [Paenibacillus lentus]